MTRSVPAAFNHRKGTRLCAGFTGLLLTAGLVATIQAPANATPDPDIVAVMSALTSGGSVTLTKNVTVPDPVTVSGNATVELSGYTLTFADETGAGGAELTIPSDATLTFRDSQGTGQVDIAADNGVDGSPYAPASLGTDGSLFSDGGAGGTGLSVQGHLISAAGIAVSGGNGGAGSTGQDGGPGNTNQSGGSGGPGGAGGVGGTGIDVGSSGTITASSLNITGFLGGAGGTGGNPGVNADSTTGPDGGSTGAAGGAGGEGGTGLNVSAGGHVIAESLTVASSTAKGGFGGAAGLTPTNGLVINGSGGTGGQGGGSVENDGAIVASVLSSPLMPGGGLGGLNGDRATLAGSGTTGTSEGITAPAKFEDSAVTPDSYYVYVPSTQVVSFTLAQAVAVLPTSWLTRDGYTLTWYSDSTEQNSDTEVSNTAVVPGHTVYAGWQLNSPPAPQSGTTPRAPFTDVPAGAPFASDISWLKAQRITGGFADGSFHPTASITREAMAAFLYRQAHGGADAAAPSVAPYPDVPETAPFAGAIAWLKAHGITTGYADGGFHPATVITRAATAAFLYRADHDGEDAGTASTIFADVPADSPFSGDIGWLQTQGITTGYQGGTFRPGNHITREAVAAFLHRAE